MIKKSLLSLMTLTFAFSFLLLVAGQNQSVYGFSIGGSLDKAQVANKLKEAQSLVKDEKWNDAEKKLDDAISKGKSLKWKKASDKNDYVKYGTSAKAAIKLKQKEVARGAIVKMIQLVSGL